MTRSASEPVLPGSTIGILGGGQLGRMTALAARRMGYDVHVLDPDPDCSARPVASRCITARFDDADAAAELARACNVVTLEIEQISLASLEAVARHAPLRPSAAAVYIIQDRVRQKRWLRDTGFPVGAFREARSAEELEAAVRELGPSIAKSSHGGYDGRGQVRLRSPEEAAGAWRALAAPLAIVEQLLELEREISVLVARRPNGETVVYPAAQNHHTNGVLTWSVLPAPSLAPSLATDAHDLARDIATRLDLVGLLAVEMFWTTDGRLLVNELAPRPHNTYHASMRVSATSQFEQLVRAICDLPLGSTDSMQAGAIHNVLGDAWTSRAPRITDALTVPTAALDLYGKRGARPGRKMGHLSTVAETADVALARVLEAYERLVSPGTD